MSKLQPLKVVANPCPECGSASTTFTSNSVLENGCLYENFHCDTCGLDWSAKLICEEDVEGLKIIDISGDDDDDESGLYPLDYPDFGWHNINPPPGFED